ncbi:hypothetical protein [Streptomyces sp. NPDC002467]|uniref:hypothetical protein n=1 Tax=Streptomyces sp. NPDC002467 TaxID=3364647 RepID=UPI003697B409
MRIRRATWNRFLGHPAAQFAIVAVLVLILFELVALGVSAFLDAIFGRAPTAH